MLDRERFDSLRTDSIESVLDPALFRRLADELLALGAAVVGLKLGEHGLYLRTTDRAERLAHAGAAFAENQAKWLNRELLTTCFQVDVRGTTGAGDCTVAGLLASLLDGQGPDQAVIHATAVGACSVENADATSGDSFLGGRGGADCVWLAALPVGSRTPRLEQRCNRCRMVWSRR